MGRFELKKYEVLIQDEWNNLYQMGFYDKLEDTLPDVNGFLSVYNTKIDKIKEYPSTFGPCFDTEVETPNGDIIMVRGFILG